MTIRNDLAEVEASQGEFIDDEKTGIESSHYDNVSSDRGVDTTLTAAEQKKLMYVPGG